MRSAVHCGQQSGGQQCTVGNNQADSSALWATIRRTPVHCGQLGGHQCTVGNNLGGQLVAHQSTVVVWVARQGNTGTGAGCWWPVIGCERSRKVLPHITTWTPQLAAALRNYSN